MAGHESFETPLMKVACQLTSSQSSRSSILLPSEHDERDPGTLIDEMRSLSTTHSFNMTTSGPNPTHVPGGSQISGLQMNRHNESNHDGEDLSGPEAIADSPIVQHTQYRNDITGATRPDQATAERLNTTDSENLRSMLDPQPLWVPSRSAILGGVTAMLNVLNPSDPVENVSMTAERLSTIALHSDDESEGTPTPSDSVLQSLIGNEETETPPDPYLQSLIGGTETSGQQETAQDVVMRQNSLEDISREDRISESQIPQVAAASSAPERIEVENPISPIIPRDVSSESSAAENLGSPPATSGSSPPETPTDDIITSVAHRFAPDTLLPVSTQGFAPISSAQATMLVRRQSGPQRGSSSQHNVVFSNCAFHVTCHCSDRLFPSHSEQNRVKDEAKVILETIMPHLNACRRENTSQTSSLQPQLERCLDRSLQSQEARFVQIQSIGNLQNESQRQKAIDTLQMFLGQFEREIRGGFVKEGIYGYMFATLKLVSILLYCDDCMKLPHPTIEKEEHILVLENLVRVLACCQENLSNQTTILRVALADYFLTFGCLQKAQRFIMDAVKLVRDPEARRYCQARFDYLMKAIHQTPGPREAPYKPLLQYFRDVTEQNCLELRHCLMAILRHLKYGIPLGQQDRQSEDYEFMWENWVIPGTSLSDNGYACNLLCQSRNADHVQHGSNIKEDESSQMAQRHHCQQLPPAAATTPTAHGEITPPVSRYPQSLPRPRIPQTVQFGSHRQFGTHTTVQLNPLLGPQSGFPYGTQTNQPAHPRLWCSHSTLPAPQYPAAQSRIQQPQASRGPLEFGRPLQGRCPNRSVHGSNPVAMSQSMENQLPLGHNIQHNPGADSVPPNFVTADHSYHTKSFERISCANACHSTLKLDLKEDQAEYADHLRIPSCLNAPVNGWPRQPPQGYLTQPLPGQAIQPLPGQLIHLLQGQPTQALPGQPPQPLQGQPTQSLLGQPIQPLLGQPMLGQPTQPLLGQPMLGQPTQPPPGQPTQSLLGQPIQPMHGQTLQYQSFQASPGPTEISRSDCTIDTLQGPPSLPLSCLSSSGHIGLAISGHPHNYPL